MPKKSAPAISADLTRAGGALREIRESLGLSIRGLAKLCEISYAHLSRMEAGRDFTFSKLIAVCAALGVPPAFLIARAVRIDVSQLAKTVIPAIPSDRKLASALDLERMEATALQEMVEILLDTILRLFFSASALGEIEEKAREFPWMRAPLLAFGMHAHPERDFSDRAVMFRSILAAPFDQLRALGFLSPETIRGWVESERRPGSQVAPPGMFAQKAVDKRPHCEDLSPVQIADRLKKIRATLNLTQRQAAERWKIPFKTWQRWEYGKTQPRGFTLAQLENILRSEEHPSG